MIKKAVYLLLAVSLGVNAGLMVVTLYNRTTPPDFGPPGPPPDHDRYGPGDGPGRRPDNPDWLTENHVSLLTRYLDLDTEQQQAIADVVRRFASDLLQAQARSLTAGDALSAAYAEPGFDPDGFRRLVAEASAARTALDSLSAEALVAEAALLTESQRAKFADLVPFMHHQPDPPPGDRRPPR